MPCRLALTHHAWFWALCALALAGCSLWETKTSDEDLKPPLTTAELQDDLKQTSTVLVDVRMPRDFAREHIPGAINIPLPDMRVSDPALGQAQTIITTSKNADDYLAAAGAKKLIALGYSNVQDYRGGLEQWKRDGQSTESSPAPATTPAAEPAPQP